jgi:hypothetical protein
MKCSPFIHFTLLLILTFTISSCKSQASTSQPESYYILVHLEEGVMPSDFEDFSSLDTDKIKRTSRSQNLWMVKHDGSKEAMNEIILKLSDNEKIIKIELIDENEQPNNH